MANNNNGLPQFKNRLPSKLSTELIAFADSLCPSDEYIKSGKESVQKVFELLKCSSNFSISRHFIGGSVGKKTSVIYPDFDCTVFLNNLQPPLQGKVDAFEVVIKENADALGIVKGSISKSSITVSFKFTNGVDMDLLPACSYDPNPELQYKEVLKQLKKQYEEALRNPMTDKTIGPPSSKYTGFSSSLAEIQMSFMRNQSSAAHQLVRLAKYWYKLCTLNEYVYGGSSIIEILCIDVVQDMDKDGTGGEVSANMLEAFRAFLEKVKIIKQLKIAFIRETPVKNGKMEVKWKKVSPEVLPKNNFFPAKMANRSNYILEPANPYNDLAENIKPGAVNNLKVFAGKMLDRLKQLEAGESNSMKQLSSDKKDIIKVHYGKLFEPFELSLDKIQGFSKNAFPKEICIDYRYQNNNSKSANADERKIERNRELFEKNKPAKKLYNVTMKILQFLIRGKAIPTMKRGLSFTNGITDVESEKDVKAAVQSFLDANSSIFGAGNVKISGSNKDHADCDVTLSIPYRKMGTPPRIYAVRFSMKW